MQQDFLGLKNITISYYAKTLAATFVPATKKEQKFQELAQLDTQADTNKNIDESPLLEMVNSALFSEINAFNQDVIDGSLQIVTNNSQGAKVTPNILMPENINNKFEQPIKNEMNLYNSDLAIADRAENERVATTKTLSSQPKLLNELTSKQLKLYKIKVHTLTDDIEEMLQTTLPKKSFETFQKTGKVHKYTLNELLEASVDSKAWQNLCVDLTKRTATVSSTQFNKLRQQCISLMVYSTEINYLQEIVAASKDEPIANEAQLIETLETKRAYSLKSPKASLYLYFEYVSKMRIRPRQVELLNIAMDTLEKDNNTDIGLLFQMMMGGGKTSVIMSYLIDYIAKQKNKLPVFICHHSQFETASSTLEELQMQRFNKRIVRISPSQAELANLFSLERMVTMLHEAKTQNTSIVIQNTTLHYLELEYIRLCKEKKPLALNKISALSKILNFFRNETIGLFDESHLNLKITDIVNIPIDEKKRIDANKVNLLHDIYQELATLETMDKSLAKNQQSKSLVDTKYQSEIIALLAEKLYARYSNEFKVIKANFNQNDLIKYLITPYNNELLAKLNDLSAKGENKEILDKIVTIRYLLLYILPSTLAQNTNEHYGFNINTAVENKKLEVVPYQSSKVPTPEGTKFGNEFESLACMYQTWLSCPITENMVKNLALLFDKAARDEIINEPELAYNETVANHLFKSITGITLAEFTLSNNQESIKKAITVISNNLDSRLALAKEFSVQFITSNDKVVSSNNVNLGYGLYGAFGCSGTPSNLDTYFQKLTKNVQLEAGSNGKIMLKLLTDEAEKKLHVSQISPDNAVANTLDKISASFSNNKPITTLIDAGAIFKDVDNLLVAKEILEKIANSSTAMRAVMFFDQDSGKFQILSKNGNKYRIIPLDNTSKATLESSGFKIEEIFVYYDEPHVTGTDIKLSTTAHGLLTVNTDNTTQDKILQATLRLRQFFDQQTLDIAVLSLEKEPPTLQAIFTKAIATQAEQKANETYQAFSEMIVASFREAAMQQLLATNDDAIISQLVSSYEELLVKSEETDLFKKYAGLGKESAPAEVLKLMLAAMTEKYSMLVAQSTTLEKELEQLHLSITKNQSLFPTTVMTSGSTIGTTVTQKQIQTTVAKNTIAKNSVAIKNFKQQYQQMQARGTRINGESKMCFSDNVIQMEKNRNSSKSSLAYTKFKDLPLADVDQYAKLFPEDFALSDNYFSMFDISTTNAKRKQDNFSLFKEALLNKTCNYVLFLKDSQTGTMQTIIPSQAEVSAMNDHLVKSGNVIINNGVKYYAYIYTMNGDNLIEEGNELNIEDQEHVQQSLFYANLYRGDLDNLLKNKEALAKIATAHPKELKEYLAYKNARHSDSYLTALITRLAKVTKNVE